MKYFYNLFRNPKIFFLGVAIGIALCSYKGRIISNKSYYENFIRIGGAHSTGRSYFVTASQISALIRKTCNKNQILILAGGSSVIMGSGQPIRYLWTKRLQELLGPEYCVFNLAAPAGGLTGYASVTLEMIGREYKNAILVSDSSVPPSEADGMIWYKHFFWDAYYKGLLENSPIKYTTDRINDINNAKDTSDSPTKARIEQVKIGMWLDSFLYFNDLWTYIHYSIKQTIYDPLAGTLNWRPRKEGSDYDYEIDENEMKTLKHFPSPDSLQFAGELNVVKGFRASYYKLIDGKQIINEDILLNSSKFIKNHPLTDISHNIIITIIPESAYYRNKLSHADQEDYINLREKIEEIWEKNGYSTVMMNDLAPEDNGDRVHINTLGGWKLADKVATKIKYLSNLKVNATQN